MKLVVANVTKQKQIFFHRLETVRTNPNINPNEPAKQIAIDPGKQAQVGPDFNTDEDMNVVIKQLVRAGGRPAEDVKRLGSTLTTFLFAKGRSVRGEEIRIADENNQRIKSDVGAVRRKKAAVATNETVQKIVENDLREKGIPEDKVAAATPHVDVAFEQVDEIENQSEKPVDEHFKVADQPEAYRPSKPRRRKG